MRTRATTAAAAAVALALAPTSAMAQGHGGPLRIEDAPTIAGTPVAGATLTAGGGTWSSPQPERTEASWDWWSCPSPKLDFQCQIVARTPTLLLDNAMVGRYVHLRRSVALKSRSEVAVTQTPAGPVAPAAVQSTPTPPAPAPVAAPRFDTGSAAPTPVPTAAPVLRQSGKRRVIRPFPIVRIRGRLTYRGARVTILSIRAPRSAKVVIRCTGDCPLRRWTVGTRRRNVTRARRFERDLEAGTRITVLVTRKGYVGKRTTFVIRRGSAPRRSDACLSARGRVTRCPS